MDTTGSPSSASPAAVAGPAGPRLACRRPRLAGPGHAPGRLPSAPRPRPPVCPAHGQARRSLPAGPGPAAQLGRGLAGEGQAEHPLRPRPCRWRPARPAGRPWSRSCPSPAPAITASGSSGAAITAACSRGRLGQAEQLRQLGGAVPGAWPAVIAGHLLAPPRAPGSWRRPGRSGSPGSPWPRTPARPCPRRRSRPAPAPSRVRVVGQRALRAAPGPARPGWPCRPGPARRRPARSGRAPRTRRAARRAGRRRAAGSGPARRRQAGPCRSSGRRRSPCPSSSRSSRSTRPVISTRPTWTRTLSSTATRSRGLSRCQARNLLDHLLGLLPLLLAVPGAAEVQVVPDLVDPLADRRVVGALGGEHRGGVDDGAEVADHVRRPGPGGRLEQPAQPALGEGLHLRRRDPHQRAAGGWAVSGTGRAASGPGSDSLVSAYQCRGRRRGPRLRPAGPAGRRRPAAARAGAAGRRRPGAGRRSARAATASAARDPVTCSISISSPASSARNRDGRSSLSSPPAAVTTSAGGPGSPRRRTAGAPRRAAWRRARRRRRRSPAACPFAPVRRVHQLVHAQQRAAQPQVRPDAFLHAGHHDHVPLQALGPVRGEDAHGLAGRRPLGQRVAGDLLAGQAVQEQPGRPGRQPLGEPGRRVEQRDHRVEVAVGGGAAAAAGRARRLPRPGQAGGLPHRPQHVVRGAAARRCRGRAPSRPATRRAASAAGTSIRVRSRGSRSAAASGVFAPSPPRRACAAARSARRSRRRPSASVPPSGPVSSSAAASSSSVPGRSAHRSSSSSGRAPGSAASGSSSPATTAGTPAVGQGALQQRDLTDRGPDQHRHRRPGACRPSGGRGAACPRSPRPPGWRWRRSITRLDHRRRAGPGPAARPGHGAPAWLPAGSLAGDPAGGGQQDRAAAPAGAQRDDPAGRPSGVRNRSGNRAIACTSAPRKA